MQTFFIAPTDFGVGLTSISLGLVRTLERAGLKVGFFKPIAQPHPGDTGPERSTELVARTHGLKPPQPLGLAHVERMLGDGQLDELLEEIITLYQQAAIGKDVLVVEGMVPTRNASYAARVNLHLAKSLDAEVILVSAPENEVLTELSGRVELQAQLFGGPKDPKVLGVILNKVRTEESMEAFSARLKEHSPLLRSGDFRLLGCIPFRPELNAPRTRDVADLMGAQVLNAGDYETRRMSNIIICARTMRNTVELLKPGVLVVTPGDRDDIILAVSLAAINGVPLAGLLLTSDTLPDPRIMDLCRGALQAGLPVLSVSTGSYDTANQLNGLNKEIPVDDRERAELITDFVASYLDADWLHQRCGTPRELRLSPAVFRYQLIQRALAQFEDARVGLAVAGQQQARQRYTVDRRQAHGEDDVVAIPRGHHQRAGLEQRHGIGHGAGADDDLVHPPGFVVAGIEYLGAEQFGHVAGAWVVEAGLEGDAAEQAEVAAAQQRRMLDQARGEGAHVLVGAHLVENYPEHFRVAWPAKQLGLQFDAPGQLGEHLVFRCRHQDHFGIQALGQVQVDPRGVAGVAGRDHAFDHHHVLADAGLLVESNDFLEQLIQLAVAQHTLDMGQAQRLRWLEAMGAGNQFGGAFRAGIARVRLGNRLEEANLQPGTLQGAHQAQADGGQADAKVGRRDKKCLHASFSK